MRREHARVAVPADAPWKTLRATPTERASDRAHPMLRLQQSLGNQAVQRIVQASLVVAAPQSDHEREADAASERALEGESASRPSLGLSVTANATASTDVSALPVAPPLVESALRASGAPLEPSTRHAMEASLGHDFSAVRVHTGAEAAASAHAIGAHAYTVGTDVVFGAGRYAPDSSEGRRLLGHELAHVVQQQPPSTARLVQRQPATGVKGLPSKPARAQIEGRRLGKLYPGSSALAGIPLEATLEVVPSTEEAGLFDGYANLNVARAVANARPTICAVVLDKIQKRYRVFETGVPIITWSTEINISTNESGPDYELTEFVNLTGPQPPDPKEHKERLEHAQALRKEYMAKYKNSMAPDVQREADLRKLQNAYLALFEEAAPFARGQFHASLEMQEFPTSGPTRPVTTADPGSINFNVLDAFKGGFESVLNTEEPGSATPTAHTHITPQDVFALFSDPAQPPLFTPFAFDPYVSLTVDALTTSYPDVRSVILHEEAHRAHSQLALRLLGEWVTEGSTPTFKEWTLQKVKKGQLSPVEGVLAIEQAGPGKFGAHMNTELLAEVEGFMAVYHVQPAAGSLALARFPTLAMRWTYSAPEVQYLALRKLRHYYWTMLGSEYRTAMDQYVVDKQVGGDKYVDFYNRLAAEFAVRP